MAEEPAAAAPGGAEKIIHTYPLIRVSALELWNRLIGNSAANDCEYNEAKKYLRDVAYLDSFRYLLLAVKW